MKKPRIGRPPLGRTTVRVNLKLSGVDHTRWLALAKRQGITLSEAIREAMRMAVALRICGPALSVQ